MGLWLVATCNLQLLQRTPENYQPWTKHHKGY
jgi:hypothetical protein